MLDFQAFLKHQLQFYFHSSVNFSYALRIQRISSHFVQRLLSEVLGQILTSFKSSLHLYSHTGELICAVRTVGNFVNGHLQSLEAFTQLVLAIAGASTSSYIELKLNPLRIFHTLEDAKHSFICRKDLRFEDSRLERVSKFETYSESLSCPKSFSLKTTSACNPDCFAVV